MAKLGTLKNTVTLITGGATGIGRGVAERFVKEGGKVVICDLPDENGPKLEKQLGSSAMYVATDVRNTKSIAKALKKTEERFGCLNNVVNCASIMTFCKAYSFARLQPHSQAIFDNVLKINTEGTFDVNRQAIAYLNKNKIDEENDQRGVIINTSSIISTDGQIGQSAMSASTGGISAMTLPAARDLAQQNIRVVTIAAGFFESPDLDEIMHPKEKVILASLTPFPSRFGHPDEFAHLCQSIIENPYMNGGVIRLDGAIRLLP